MYHVIRIGLITAAAFALSAVSAANGADTPQVTGQALAMSFHQQIYRCWNPPVPADGKQAIIVRLDVHFDVDGKVVSPPTPNNRLDSNDPGVRAAIEAATKAVYACAPYKLPAAQYSVWKEIVITFDPSVLQDLPR